MEKTVPPISFGGKYTVADAYAAGNLAEPLGNKISRWFILVFLGTAFFYMCWYTIYCYHVEDYNQSRIGLGGILLAFFPIGLFIFREFRNRKLANQLCREEKYIYKQTEGEIDHQSIRAQSDKGESVLYWSSFCAYRASDRIVILFMEDETGYAFIGRSKFANDQDWTRFLELVDNKLEHI